MRTLKEIVKDYNDNYVLLVSTVGTPEHNKYVKIERKLYREEFQVRNKNNILCKDTCPTSTTKSCFECTGRFVPSNQSYGPKFIESEDGDLCPLKNV